MCVVARPRSYTLLVRHSQGVLEPVAAIPELVMAVPLELNVLISSRRRSLDMANEVGFKLLSKSLEPLEPRFFIWQARGARRALGVGHRPSSIAH